MSLQQQSDPNFQNTFDLALNGPLPDAAPEMSSGRFQHFKGLAMVLLGAILWGVSGTAAQVLFQHDAFNAGWLVSVRMGGAGLLLLIGLAIKSGPMRTLAIWRNKGDAVRIVIFSIVGLLGVQYSYLASIRYGNAATATMLQYMGPLFITVFVALRQRRMPSLLQLMATGLALVGALLLVTDGNFRSFSIAPLAVFWGLLSAVTLAFYSLYPKPLLQTYSSATIVGWAMLIGSVVISFVTPPWHFTGVNSISAWVLVAFVVLFGTLIAFYMYLASLAYISPVEASLLSCGEPLSASFIAIVLLHVHMGILAMLGGLCIIVMVTILAGRRAVC